MKINISCGLGSPSSPRTWSGTPYNFLKALKSLQGLEVTFEPEKENGLFRLSKKILYLFYSRFSSKKGGSIKGLSWPFLRYLYAHRIQKLTSISPSKYTLHFGTLDLPFLKLPKKQSHYLYTDGTWNLWSRYSTISEGANISKTVEELERKSYSQVEHIFSISDYVKENLERHYKIPQSKITVVGSGPGIIQPYFGEKDYNNGKILFVAKGRFEDKGGLLVLEAFKRATAKNPNLHLSIVGQDNYDFISRQTNISTYGFIPLDQLQNLFNTHCLFLMPALNEPWGLVYIEAMLCKMPIIGLNRNSFPELSGNGTRGIAIDKPEPELLAEVLLHCFNQPELLHSMGMEAQDYALKNFSWEATVSKVINKIAGIA